MSCIFCQIVEGKAPCHKVWEDEHHLAFLSIYPNTDGFTVVIPKKHYPSYAFDMPPQALADLVLATQKVAKLLDKSFDDVGRTGMFLKAMALTMSTANSVRCTAPGICPNGGRSSRVRLSFAQYEGYLSSTITSGRMMKSWQRWRPESEKHSHRICFAVWQAADRARDDQARSARHHRAILQA